MKRPCDWTAQPETDLEAKIVCPNDSDRFRHLEDEVAALIRSHPGMSEDVDVRSIAGVILAQLAHVHGVTVANGPCPCRRE